MFWGITPHMHGQKFGKQKVANPWMQMEDIGDGKSFNNWIPGHQALKMEISNVNEENKEHTFDSFIDSNTKWWNVEKVRVLFNPNIAAEILRIIICLGEEQDK